MKLNNFFSLLLFTLLCHPIAAQPNFSIQRLGIEQGFAGSYKQTNKNVVGTYPNMNGNSCTGQQVTLLFAGDAMQHQIQLNNAFRQGKYDYSSYFQYIRPEIEKADIAIVNLETTLGGKPYTGYPMFCSPDEYALALKEAGFDIFLNANNHILDRF